MVADKLAQGWFVNLVHNIAELVRTSAGYGEIRATLTAVYRLCSVLEKQAIRAKFDPDQIAQDLIPIKLLGARLVGSLRFTG